MGRLTEFRNLMFRPIVNKASRPSYVALLEKKNLLDVMEGKANPRNYRDLLASADVKVGEFIFQDDVPGLREETDAEGRKVMIPAAKGVFEQPGGHGQIGVLEFVSNPEDWKPNADGSPSYRPFTNGDGQKSSRLSPEIVGHSLKNRYAISNLVTPATRVDRKGGKYIVRLLEYLGIRKWIPGQREEAAAKEMAKVFIKAKKEEFAEARKTAGDISPEKEQADVALAEKLGQKIVEDFYAAGQPDGEAIFGAGSSGKQPFNTNSFYVFEDVLMPFLAELKSTMGEDAYFAEVISPNFMKKDTKKGKDGKPYYPLDSAVGNVFHNINEFVMQMRLIEEASRAKGIPLTEEQQKIIDVLDAHHMQAVVHYYNVPRSFFTPQKNPLDAVMQMVGRYYELKLATSTLDETEAGLVPPDVTILDAQGNAQESGNGHYSEFLNLLSSFVTTDSVETILNSTFDNRKLDKLDIVGNVAVRDAIWIGNVKITNRNKSADVVDLGAAILASAKLQADIGYVAGQPLTLKDVVIDINAAGAVNITRSEARAVMPARSESRVVEEFTEESAPQQPKQQWQRRDREEVTVPRSKSDRQHRGVKAQNLEEQAEAEMAAALEAAQALQQEKLARTVETEILNPYAVENEALLIQLILKSFGVEPVDGQETVTKLVVAYDGKDAVQFRNAVESALGLNPLATITIAAETADAEASARIALKGVIGAIAFEMGDVESVARRQAEALFKTNRLSNDEMKRSVFQILKTGEELTADDVRMFALLGQMGGIVGIFNSKKPVSFATQRTLGQILQAAAQAAESIAKSA